MNSMEFKHLLQYDCCAVREVLSTTNDFDKTPWCTTSGSCQATTSQIPRTCCKGVTQDDYQNAPTKCHASVESGTYRQVLIFFFLFQYHVMPPLKLEPINELQSLLTFILKLIKYDL